MKLECICISPCSELLLFIFDRDCFVIIIFLPDYNLWSHHRLKRLTSRNKSGEVRAEPASYHNHLNQETHINLTYYY